MRRTASQALTDQLLGAAAPSADTMSSAIAQSEALRQQLVEQQVETVQSLRALQHSLQFAAARGMLF